VRIAPATLKELPRNPKGNPLEIATHRRHRRRQSALGS